MDKMCFRPKMYLSLLITSLALCSIVNGLSMDDFLARNYEVRDFFDYINKNAWINATLNYMPGTIFAPTNDALKIFKTSRQMKDKILLYHYCNSPHSYRDLETKDSVTTAVPGNTAIWVTKKGSSLFVNDAAIIRTDLIFETKIKHVVHIIDQVLEPTLKVSEDRGIDSPSAREFMDHPKYYDVIGDYTISKFQEQVNRQGKASLYSDYTKGTYFIPIDRAFATVSPSKLEARVIEGHVIPDNSIFLRTAELGMPVEAYRPNEFQANTPILITFKKDIGTSGNYKDMWFVNSDNRQTDPRHHKGVVQAEIVRGNIIVRNGVVHLISKPLVLIDTNVYETFEWYSTKQVWSMREFFKFVMENSKLIGLEGILKDPKQHVTLFVPSDRAMRESEVLKSLTFQRNTSAILEIIKSHIVYGGISSLEISDAIKKSKNHVIMDALDSNDLNKSPTVTTITQVPTILNGRKLLFSMTVNEDGKKTFHVEGYGANATILQPDIGATNGFIHIIDKVLGIPDFNVSQKLATNPMLQLTNHIWKKEKVVSILNNTAESFTFFAPSEKAWVDLSKKSKAGQSAYDGLMYGNPGEVATKIFKRLIIPDHMYTIDVLAALSKIQPNATATKIRQNSKENISEPHYPLQSINGYLKVNETRIKKDYGPIVGVHDEIHYYVYWKNMKALIVRPNVKCTNGIIHIIDEVLMDDEEIAVASAQKQFYSLIGILSCSIVTIFAKYVIIVN